MAARQNKAAAEQPAAEQTAADQPTDEQPTEAATAEGSDTTTDYTRRAGGYVLTDRGWTIEALAEFAEQTEEGK